MAQLDDALLTLAERAEPLPIGVLLERIELQLTAGGTRPQVAAGSTRVEDRPAELGKPFPVASQWRRWWQRPLVAFGAAAIGIAVLIGAAAAAGWFGAGTDLADTPTPNPTEPVAPPEALGPVTLIPAPNAAPIRVETALGDLEVTMLRSPPVQELGFFRDVAITPHGPVAIGSDSLWWSSDYATWHGIAGIHGRQITTAGADIVVHGDFSGAVRFAWDGSGWVEMERLDLPGWVPHLVFGPRGAVAWTGTTMYWSADGQLFTEAEGGPDLEVYVPKKGVPDEDREFGDCRLTAFSTAGQIRELLATNAGFVALTSARHPYGELCEPLLWFSADGDAWELVSPGSPFGNISSLDTGIVARDGRFVVSGVVGGQGLTDEQAAVWVSDDGLTWQQTDAPLNGVRGIGALVAGELGWMRVGTTGPEEDGYPSLWFSTDASSWDGPYELSVWDVSGYSPYLPPPQFAVGSDTIFGIGFQEQVFMIGRLED